MAKITLTKAEANEIIRKHFGVASDFEIEIAETNSDASSDDSDWIKVISDWKFDFAPPHVVNFKRILVMFTNGAIHVCSPTTFTNSWNCTNEDGVFIVKYRKVS